MSSEIVWRKYQREWIDDPNRLAIAAKAAQIGYSMATAAWAIGECLEKPNHLTVFISRSEPQARELVRKAKRLIDGYRGIDAQLTRGFFQGGELLESIIRFSNGSRIIALSSNPETARGYTGDVVLDEFAFHPDSDEVFKSAFRQITLGHKMRVLSTPHGQQGRFFELAKQCGLENGEPDWVSAGGGPRLVNGWSAHWCDIYRAHREGFPVNPESVRAGCDTYTWEQEFLCVFLSGDLLWIPPPLLDPAVSIKCPLGPPFGEGPYYAGWDIARKRDLSIIWFLQAVGEMRITAGVVELSGMPTPSQIEQARAWMPVIERMDIDSTGMGLAIFETLHKDFPEKVGAMQFTAASKEKMAVNMRGHLERHLLKLPDAAVVRRSFGSIRRAFTSTGQARFDAEHDKLSGHADHFWAACLALAASEQQSHPIIRWSKRKVAEMQQAVEHPKPSSKPAENPAAVSVEDNVRWTRAEFNRILRRW